ncbi:MAG: hypothetical protein Q9190_006223 [Brigantiaea leucoxantha]
MEQAQQARPGDLSWRLSSHPITLLFFLAFRISCNYTFSPSSSPLTPYGDFIPKEKLSTYKTILQFNQITNTSTGSILVFILTILLLAADFYYLKNIAGRRLVGLRWWNEVNTSTGDSHWVFESQDRSSPEAASSGQQQQNATDKRFFWLALYAQPALWVALAVVSVVRLQNPIWLSLVGQ